MTSPEQQLDLLFGHYIEGRASRDDLALLDQRLLEDRIARDRFRNWLMLDSLLAEKGTLAPDEILWSQFTYGGHSIPEQVLSGAAVESSRSGGFRQAARWMTAVFAACAASVLVIGWSLSGSNLARSGRQDGIPITAVVHSRPESQPLISAGKVLRSANVQWSPSAQRWSVGDILHEDERIQLASGSIELLFDSGAVMTLAGPAELEVRSAYVAVLHAGTATTRVENVSSRLFRVLTPRTEVIDLGTEFGVRVDLETDEAEVVVFEGAVDLVPIEQSSKTRLSRVLQVGEGVRITKAGDLERVVSVDASTYPFGDRMFSLPPRRPPVIGRVTDDRRDPKSPKFYQIFHQGLDEDVRAYVDRPYQWNGVTPEGIPSFLRGADYIATFNNDKHNRRVESPTITVELLGPADLYLFYDDRMTVPEWLSENFEDTGARIGLDAGDWGPEPVASLEAGPGVSIDCICHVWRRRMEQGGPVVLEPIGKPRDPGEGIRRRAMIGIAAQPVMLRNPPPGSANNIIHLAMSSLHEGGAQVGMADGSVRFISENIQHTQRVWGDRNKGGSKEDPYDLATGGSRYGVYQRLWSIADGLPIGEF